MRTLKIQPTRLDARRASNPINLTEGSTQGQRHWAWVYKAEWNKVLSDSTFGEVRGGQFGYDWPLLPNANATGPRIEDLSNSLVTGPNLHRQQNRRRNQVLGSISYFVEGLAGSHDLKFGGEVFHETFFEEFLPTTYGNLAVSFTRNGAPVEVDLLDPGAVEATLMTYSFFANDTWRLASRRALLSRVSLKLYSGATRSMPRRSALGLTKVSREQPLATSARATASSQPSRNRIAAPDLPDPLAELRLAPGAIHHLALELAARGIDVVAARRA